MEEMNNKEIKEIIEWCDEKGHTEHEILDLIRRIVGAKPREEEQLLLCVSLFLVRGY